MQGKCNLLKPVNCKTGTFFMFSQYAQDLTREYTMPDNYRCVPSSFAALNLKTNGCDDKKLGEIFQNYFENACCFLRSEMGTQWKGEYSLPIIWNTLSKYELIAVKNTGNEYHSEDVKYIGDINIYSYNPTDDGIGYNEIYCYIPNDAKPMDYVMYKYTGEDFEYSGDSICGYSAEGTTYNGLTWSLNNGSLKYYDDNVFVKSYGYSGVFPYKLNYLTENTEQDRNQEEESEGDSFQFNSILVFYDIVSKGTGEDSDIVLHHNIPLGIWFTGTPLDDGTLTNTVTKFVTNEDIYNQGTSYGLRICSRFLCTPNMTKFENVEVTSSDLNDHFTQALSAMASNCELFRELSKEMSDINQDITTHMINFRNNKTNVPYLRQVNDDYYWFVNGKNTGVAANAVSQEDITLILKELESLTTSIEETVTRVIDKKIEEGTLDITSIDATTIQNVITSFKNILG